MDITTYSKYVMPHGQNNLQYICHATWTQQLTVNMSCHINTTTYSKLSCHMDTTTYSIYVMPHDIVYMSCHMDPTTYSKYVMPHGPSNLQYICHATLTEQPTIHMSCHVDTTTYNKYVMPHGRNNLQ